MKSVAVDGPSGAGKSSVVKTLAKTLGFAYMDTGAIYRTVGLFACRYGITPADIFKVIPLLPEARVEVRYEDGQQRNYLNGEEVSGLIRSQEMSAYASAISAIPEVRDKLLMIQRRAAEEYNIFMDGRDIGTVVLPNADLKIFLTASPEERARRRYEQNRDKEPDMTLETTLEAVLARDKADSTRSVAPLRQAEDAVLVDTTHINEEETVAYLLNLCRERLGL